MFFVRPAHVVTDQQNSRGPKVVSQAYGLIPARCLTGVVEYALLGADARLVRSQRQKVDTRQVRVITAPIQVLRPATALKVPRYIRNVVMPPVRVCGVQVATVTLIGQQSPAIVDGNQSVGFFVRLLDLLLREAGAACDADEGSGFFGATLTFVSYA